MAVLLCVVYLGLFLNVQGDSCAASTKLERTCQPGRVQSHDLVNVALNKKFTSLDTLVNGDKLLDGNINNSYPCTHTTTGDYFLKYMLVDLGTEFNVSSVYLHVNPNEGLHGIEIHIGATPERMVMYYYSKGIIADDCTVVFVHPFKGRYVKVAKRGKEDLNLCGLEVFSVAGFKPGRN